MFCAGVDKYVRIFDLENQHCRFSLHPYCTSQMLVIGEILYTYGYDKTIVKYNFKTEEKLCMVQCSKHIDTMKIIKHGTGDFAQIRLAVSQSNGVITVYDESLHRLNQKSIWTYSQDHVLNLISVSHDELLSFHKDG